MAKTLFVTLIFISGLVLGWAVSLSVNSVGDSSDTLADVISTPSENVQRQLDAAREESMQLRQQLEQLHDSQASRDVVTATKPHNPQPLPSAIQQPTLDINEDQLAKLISASIDEEQARELLVLEAELHASLRGGRNDRDLGGSNPRELISATEEIIKKMLGVYGYDNYLRAMGRPTSVAVGGVVDDSAAEQAGLQAGDKITRYDGERVFNSRDLMDASRAGYQGDIVAIEVERDGAILFMTVPRGRLGVSRNSKSRAALF